MSPASLFAAEERGDVKLVSRFLTPHPPPPSLLLLPPPPSPESLACFSRNMKGARAVYSPQISGVGPSELSLFSPRVMTVKKIAKNKTKACTYETTLNCQSARRK
ncbi:unnamed protein product [Boreogadus saida]